jgi:iron(III) transport system permease protein
MGPGPAPGGPGLRDGLRYTDFLQFVGPVQTTLREIFGWEHGDYHFPDIRTLPGAILMFVFVLYPMFTCWPAPPFSSVPAVLEAARTLGTGPWRAFFTVSLPLARPASPPASRWR